MQFPDTSRVIYRRNPLAEVIAQLRFPPILRIDSESPAAFQELIRSEYQQYADARATPHGLLPPNLPPQIAQLMQTFGAGRVAVATHQFTTPDKLWQLTLTRESLELKSTGYSRWEDFRGRLTKVLASFEEIYRPSTFVRIGLKYVNIIRKSSIGLADDFPWSELLKPYIAGELGVPELARDIDSASRQLHCQLDEDCFLTLRTGIALAEPNKERCFLIDNDFHTHKQTELNHAGPILDHLNQTSGRFFRWCIERRLHDAMEPEPVTA